MIRRNTKIIAILTLVTIGSSLCPGTMAFAETVSNNPVKSHVKTGDNVNLLAIEEVLKNIEERADCIQGQSGNNILVYGLLQNNTVDKQFNFIKNDIETVDSQEASLNNSEYVNGKEQYIARFQQVREKSYSSLQLIVENIFKAIVREGEWEKLDSSKQIANKIKDYLVNERKLESSSYVKAIEAAINNITEKEVSLLVDTAASRIKKGVKEKNSDNLMKAIEFAKEARKELRTKYKLDRESSEIKEITKEIRKGEKEIPRVKASEVIELINKAIESKDICKVKEAKEKAQSVKSELIENYGQAKDGKDVIRVESAISRIDKVIEEFDNKEPIEKLNYEREIANREQNYDKLISLLEEAKSIKANTKEREEKTQAEEALQKCILNACDAITNKIAAIDAMSKTKYKEIYDMYIKSEKFKEFIKNNTDLGETQIYKAVSSNLERFLNVRFSKNDIKKIIFDEIIKEASDSKDYSEAKTKLEECKYIRLTLMEYLKISPEDELVRSITDKISNTEQKVLSKQYEKELVINPVVNPNWSFTGLPDKIDVREKEARLNNVVVDIIANENMKIKGNRLIFVDQSNEKESALSTVTIFSEFNNDDSWFNNCKYRDVNGKVVNSVEELGDRDVQQGEVLFSIIAPTTVKAINKTYWERLQSTRTTGSKNNVTLSATMSADKSESVTKSLAKVLGTEESYGGEVGLEVSSENLGGMTSNISSSAVVSRSFESTFERSFEVSEGFEKTIEHSFEELNSDSIIGLYQMVEEVEVFNGEGILNTINKKLSSLNLSTKMQTKATVKTTRYIPIVVNKNDNMLEK